ncbi:MAG: molybdate ABC transporter substrate-binding protein [Xanthobacteraceae bacterium]
MRMTPALIAWKLFALALFAVGTAGAAEIKVLSSNSMKTTLEELAPQFEKATGHKLSFTFNAAVPLKAQIEKGAAFDVAILSTPITDDLIKQGKLVAATRTDIARSNAGLAVKRGAPKPDISTTAAFKRALLDAKSICYVEQGATGIYLKGLFERLGIAEQLKGKTKLLPPSNPAAHAVANGEAEIGMTQISEILPYAGAELVGPLPAEIQLSTLFPAAVGSGAKEPEAAKAFIKFLTAPAAIPVLKAKGLEPG